MLQVLVALVLFVITVDCEVASRKRCAQIFSNVCTPTYNCNVPASKFVDVQMCGYDNKVNQPLVCCNSSTLFTNNFVQTTLVSPKIIHLTSMVDHNLIINTIIELPLSLRHLDDLKVLGNKSIVVKFKLTNVSRYKRAIEPELFTSNPLPERESNVIPNPVALAVNTTDPPLELFTSPPLPGEASVIPAVAPLDTQSDRPDTSSIINLFTSAPLPPRANSNAPPVVAEPTQPTTKRTTPKQTKKPPVHTADTRPIVFEDSLPTTTTESDLIYFPDKVPSLTQDLETQINELSIHMQQTTTSQPTLAKILPNRHTCGFQKNSRRFADSSMAGLDEFPWMALLRYVDNSNQDAGFRCSGTLISDRYVLTAAHCLTIDSLCVQSVRLGEWKVSSRYDCILYRGRTECADRVMDVPVARKIPHQKFDVNSRNNDIALLRLQMRVPFTDFVRPICLPIKNLREPQLGRAYTTSGWGTSPYGFQLDIKSKITFPVIHKSYCKEYQHFKEQMCIGYSKRHDFGKMDPGGPVMTLEFSDKPQWYLEGVISRGYGCNLYSYPGAYTRLTYYVDWLVEVVLNDAKK